ncbi:MAG: C-terminal target protein, partial [Segetibacter sp.]|nr:C-terminal target protein [Segetibacter sp.]
YSIKQTFDGGYIVAGKNNSVDGNVTNNKGATDAWVIKLDSNGNLQW